MGFNAVFGCLKEVFPQVDFRILKAVAIEHSNDVDAAVMDVLNEILPSLTRLPLSPVSPAKGQSPRVLPTPVGQKEKSEKGEQKVIKESGVGTFSEPGSTSGEDANNTYHTGGASQDDPTLVDEAHSFQDSCVIPNAFIHQAIEHQELECMNTGSKEPISVEACKNFNFKVGLQQSSSGMEANSIHETDGVSGSLNDLLSERKDFDSLVTDDFDLVMRATCDKVESCLFDFLEKKSSVQLDSPLPEPSSDPSEFCSSPLLADEKLQATGFSDLTSKNDCSPRAMSDIEESTMNSICNIDVLEEIIEDAKNNKKTLFSAMESVITMMREVELQEKAVDSVKEEAARGGLDIMVKVEELKQMLVHAKDANDMHAGEVYGEKAILSTEVKELQSRLLSLSDERDKSLAILNEMRATLESRLDTVVEARKMAELEKFEKEESAKTALAEQEAIMEKVVQESKILQQEAEENSKLQEFLMDRGRIVDMLQGEISVICQDVRLLKEKFDERVPLSLSVSSSQTSCILASSGSSVKSMASDSVLERVESSKTLEKAFPVPSVNDLSPKSSIMAPNLVLERVESSKTLEKASPVPSVDGLSPKSRREDERAAADKKALLDDGWDIFDEDTELDDENTELDA